MFNDFRQNCSCLFNFIHLTLMLSNFMYGESKVKCFGSLFGTYEVTCLLKRFTHTNVNNRVRWDHFKKLLSLSTHAFHVTDSTINYLILSPNNIFSVNIHFQVADLIYFITFYSKPQMTSILFAKPIKTSIQTQTDN